MSPWVWNFLCFGYALWENQIFSYGIRTSGCSWHVTGEKYMFQTLTSKEWETTWFGGNEEEKIIDMATIKMFVIFPFGTIHSRFSCGFLIFQSIRQKKNWVTKRKKERKKTNNV